MGQASGIMPMSLFTKRRQMINNTTNSWIIFIFSIGLGGGQKGIVPRARVKLATSLLSKILKLYMKNRRKKDYTLPSISDVSVVRYEMWDKESIFLPLMTAILQKLEK